MNNLIIIGGGAAGMMAAIEAGKKGLDVVLLEKNKMLGKKILISGKGRCNVTNNADIETIIDSFVGNGNFLYSAIYSFSNENLKQFFEERDVALKVERGERVFPCSDKSRDIVNALEKEMRKQKVDIRLNSEVKSIRKEDGIFLVELANKEVYQAKNLLITTGGRSYPRTGSTGDGLTWAEDFGHKIVKTRPALVPLVSDERWLADLQGLSLRNVNVGLFDFSFRKIREDFGEMIFTHFGVSGPIILTLSRDAVSFLEEHKRPLFLSIDLKPALSYEQLDNRIQRDFKKYSNKQLKNSLGDLLPAKIIPIVIRKSKIDPDKVVHQIRKEEREALLEALKKFTVKIVGYRSIEEAIVTAGGVDVKEVDPSTMESKIVSNLYFAGEVLDIDAVTGGFNLQGAFSTGYLAGTSINE